LAVYFYRSPACTASSSSTLLFIEDKTVFIVQEIKLAGT